MTRRAKKKICKPNDPECWEQSNVSVMANGEEHNHKDHKYSRETSGGHYAGGLGGHPIVLPMGHLNPHKPGDKSDPTGGLGIDNVTPDHPGAHPETLGLYDIFQHHSRRMDMAVHGPNILSGSTRNDVRDFWNNYIRRGGSAPVTDGPTDGPFELKIPKGLMEKYGKSPPTFSSKIPNETPGGEAYGDVNITMPGTKPDLDLTQDVDLQNVDVPALTKETWDVDLPMPPADTDLDLTTAEATGKEYDVDLSMPGEDLDLTKDVLDKELAPSGGGKYSKMDEFPSWKAKKAAEELLSKEDQVLVNTKLTEAMSGEGIRPIDLEALELESPEAAAFLSRAARPLTSAASEVGFWASLGANAIKVVKVGAKVLGVVGVGLWAWEVSNNLANLITGNNEYLPPENLTFDSSFWDGSPDGRDLSSVYAREVESTFLSDAGVWAIESLGDIGEGGKYNPLMKQNYWCNGGGWLKLPYDIEDPRKGYYYLEKGTMKIAKTINELPEIPPFKDTDFTNFELMKMGVIPHTSGTSRDLSQLSGIWIMKKGAQWGDLMAQSWDPSQPGDMNWEDQDRWDRIRRIHQVSGYEAIPGPGSKYWKELPGVWAMTWGQRNTDGSYKYPEAVKARSRGDNYWEGEGKTPVGWGKFNAEAEMYDPQKHNTESGKGFYFKEMFVDWFDTPMFKQDRQSYQPWLFNTFDATNQLREMPTDEQAAELEAARANVIAEDEAARKEIYDEAEVNFEAGKISEYRKDQLQGKNMFAEWRSQYFHKEMTREEFETKMRDSRDQYGVYNSGSGWQEVWDTWEQAPYYDWHQAYNNGEISQDKYADNMRRNAIQGYADTGEIPEGWMYSANMVKNEIDDSNDLGG